MSATLRVSDWAKSGTYTQGAVTSFYDAADYWLVAHALGQNWTVVTHEVARNSDRKIKIPDACNGLGIECIDPFEMIRRERPRFVLERASLSGAANVRGYGDLCSVPWSLPHKIS